MHDATATMAPARPQHMQALQRANEVRLARAELKRNVGDDWQAVLLWRALYDAGVFVNVAIHPAVPPGGALLRTSVMATHDRATLDRALDAFATVKADFESQHGPLPV